MILLGAQRIMHECASRVDLCTMTCFAIVMVVSGAAGKQKVLKSTFLARASNVCTAFVRRFDVAQHASCKARGYTKATPS